MRDHMKQLPAGIQPTRLLNVNSPLFSTDSVMATLNEGLSGGGSEVQISRSLQQPSAHHRAPPDLASSSQQAEVKAEK